MEVTNEIKDICSELLERYKKSIEDSGHVASGGLVNNADVLDAIKSGKVACMITDFAAEELLNQPNIIVMPHLGASTPEAEDNCAVMASKQLKDFLEKGNIVNSVNFPKTVTDNPIPNGGTRL